MDFCRDVNDLERKWGRISVHLTSKDRHSEVALCLQSLRANTYKLWDIIILDDASGTPLGTHHPTISLVNRLKFENHKVKFLRNEISNGVCSARNKLIAEDDFSNPLTLRVDDDCIYEPDYIERLVRVLEKGYHLATGIVPVTSQPEFVRENKFISNIIAKHEL
ncbi:MAG: glycosyltransferase family A protein, partial [Nanoarchaeota archaeon]